MNQDLLALRYPPAWRIVLAFLAAPAAGSAVLAARYDTLETFDRFVASFRFFLPFAYVLTVLLALPAFLILIKRLRPTLRNCVAAGAIVAASPIVLLTLPVLLGSGRGSATLGGRQMWTNGIPTLYGLWVTLLEWSVFAIAGAIGGAVFWLVAAGGHRFSRMAVSTDQKTID